MLLKKLVAVVSAVVVIAVPYVKVLADDTVITLDETAKKFVVIDKNLEYRDMLPGEERSSVIKISNSSAENMEFYINGKVLDNLADKGTGDQTAVYGIKLYKNTDTEPFYNELIGNSSKTQSDKSFFDEDVRIAQLSKGESCDIKLVLYIDGRYMDNSYMNKQGQLEITVNAEQPDLQDTVSNNVITAVKTGDSNNILLYIIVALAGIAGIAGVVVMRQRNRQ
ncbi:MAG: LPXTG cell wall anchor domain-containing protein [Eubacterium sp.]|nr:LPXTG cell wall anchor domain-containing protein [Eubacterium sp.]